MSSQVPLFSLSTPSQYPVIGLVGSNGDTADLSEYIPDATFNSALGIVAPPFSSLLLANSNRPVRAANYTHYFRVVAGGTISSIRLTVGTASGNICVAVYRNTGSGLAAVPGTRAISSGSIACPVAGVQTVSLGGSIAVNPGDWFALGADNVTATFAGFAGIGGNSSLGPLASSQAVFPAPATAAPNNGDTFSVFALIGVP